MAPAGRPDALSQLLPVRRPLSPMLRCRKERRYKHHPWEDSSSWPLLSALGMTSRSRDGRVTFRVRPTEAQRGPRHSGSRAAFLPPCAPSPRDAQRHPGRCAQAGRRHGPSTTGRHLATLGGLASKQNHLQTPTFSARSYSAVRAAAASHHLSTQLPAASAATTLGSPLGPVPPPTPAGDSAAATRGGLSPFRASHPEL